MTNRNALSRAQRRVYDALRGDKPSRAGNLGALFAKPGAPRRQPQHYARLGGKIAGQLVALGCAEWVVQGSDWGWVRR